ncbi:hypothetical protein MPUL_50250 [Mycolicibacterium pulveris]|uniref:Uncharacterized protein n=1 Tax=Mycolicibacterium pulveris TaxID=36813 RepID=A0A7I7UR84_MYCPV|nr:hypothetical protein MPUL_50250 [Mycolicibacterium pulveris]
MLALGSSVVVPVNTEFGCSGCSAGSFNNAQTATPPAASATTNATMATMRLRDDPDGADMRLIVAIGQGRSGDVT